MSEPFLGEIRAFAFPFPMRGWALCDGSILQIAQHQALYSILGATYGGNGVTTFALPDLRGRVPVHTGNGITLGQAGGEEAHVLTIGEMPPHTHVAKPLSTSGSIGKAEANVWAMTNVQAFAAAPNATMRGDALGAAGGSQPHNNMQPYQVLNYCIAIQGIYPSRN
ncbi:phage tail protein [Brevibacillus agri]|uniref:phage tail protein n=1 Tax=Brevibacillus agri TaxID=51101 RepID=UPI002867E04D|nr:tail fiber protein [Brevibacillus agri]